MDLNVLNINYGSYSQNVIKYTYIQHKKFDSFLSPYYKPGTVGKSKLAKLLKSLESNQG